MLNAQQHMSGKKGFKRSNAGSVLSLLVMVMAGVVGLSSNVSQNPDQIAKLFEQNKHATQRIHSFPKEQNSFLNHPMAGLSARLKFLNIIPKDKNSAKSGVRKTAGDEQPNVNDSQNPNEIIKLAADAFDPSFDSEEQIIDVNLDESIPPNDILLLNAAEALPTFSPDGSASNSSSSSSNNAVPGAGSTPLTAYVGSSGGGSAIATSGSSSAGASGGNAPVNQAPVVNAGSDQSVVLPNSASLNATVTDDGLPSATVSTNWNQVSGPAVAVFSNQTTLTTSVGFSAPGTYVLRITANDSALQGSDEVTITVNNPECFTDNDCNDNSVCTGTESCVSGVCQAGTPLNCDDGNSCTQDSCDAVTGCSSINLADGSSCSDNNVCNGAETCQAGSCTAGTALTCDDGLFCNGAETCDAANGCQAAAAPCSQLCDETQDTCVECLADNDCSDSNVCTGAETCISGSCVTGTPLNCDDNNACTQDSCDAVNGCASVNVTDGTSCSDSNVCNGAETCQAGSCTAGTALTCDDGLFCNGAETCDAANGCQTAAAPCSQYCDESQDLCVACLNDSHCSDNSVCTGSETCAAGACQAGTPLSCAANEICDAVQGCVCSPSGIRELDCSDSLDNDCDGLTDANDPNCAANIPPVVTMINGTDVTGNSPNPIVVNVNEGQSLSFSVTAQDADAGDHAVQQILNLPSGANFSGTSANPSAYQFTWTPGFDQAGTFSLNLEVSDGADTDTHIIEIQVSDTPPPASLNANPPSPNTGTFQLSWNAVQGAALYQVQFSSDSSFLTNIDERWPSGNSEPFSNVAPGTYHARVQAWTAPPQNGGTGTGFSSSISVVSHRAPIVNAGPDQQVQLPLTSTTLLGTASDDDLPNPQLAVSWSTVSAPDAVSFSDPASLSTTVTVVSLGTYVFRLTADDGAIQTSDDVQIVFTDAFPQCSNFSASSVQARMVTLNWAVTDGATDPTTLTYRLFINNIQYGLLDPTANAADITSTTPNNRLTDLTPDTDYEFRLEVTDPDNLTTTCPLVHVTTPRELVMDLYLSASGINQPSNCAGVFCRAALINQNYTMLDQNNNTVPASLLEIYGRYGFSKLITLVYPTTGGGSTGSFSTPGTTGILETEDNCKSFFGPIENQAVPYHMQIVPGAFVLTEAVRAYWLDASNYQCGSATCAATGNPYTAIGWVPGTYMDPNTPPNCSPTAGCTAGSPGCNQCHTYTVTQANADALWNGVRNWLFNAGRCTAAREVFLDNEFIFQATADDSHWFVDPSNGLTYNEKFWYEDDDGTDGSGNPIDETQVDNNARSYFRSQFETLMNDLANDNIRVLHYHPQLHTTHPVDDVMRTLFEGSNFSSGPYRLSDFYLADPYFVIETGSSSGLEPWEQVERWHQNFGINPNQLSQGTITKVIGENPSQYTKFGYSAHRFGRWWLSNQHFKSMYFFHGAQSPYLSEFADFFGTQSKPWRELEVTNDTTAPDVSQMNVIVSDKTLSSVRFDWEKATDDSDSRDGYCESLLVYYLYYCNTNKPECTAQNMSNINWVEQNLDMYSHAASIVKLYQILQDVETMTAKNNYPFNDIAANSNLIFALYVKDPSGNKATPGVITVQMPTAAQNPPGTPLPGQYSFGLSAIPLLSESINQTNGNISVTFYRAWDDATPLDQLTYQLYYCVNCSADNFDTVGEIEAVGTPDITLTGTSSQTNTVLMNSSVGYTLPLGNYTINVIVQDTEGKKSAYMPETFTYGPTPGMGGGISITNSNGGTDATINWFLATHAYANHPVIIPSMEYLAYYSTDPRMDKISDIESYGTPLGAYAPSVSQAVLSGLTLGTRYYVNVIVRDQFGNKAPYAKQTIRWEHDQSCG